MTVDGRTDGRADGDQGAGAAEVTLIVTPRERWSLAKRSLEVLLAATVPPFHLVYVDAGMPEPLSRWVAEEAARRGFRHLRIGHFLSPNEARNAGLAQACTPYVVFIDNDVFPSEGWLEPLLACARETGAGVVAPLICQGEPLHAEVHQAGGAFAADVAAFFAAPAGSRELRDDMFRQGEALETARAALGRSAIQTCEFHCVLVRRDLFDRIGPLDPAMLATKEHLDFSMAVAAAGEAMLLEPASVVTYVFPSRSSPLTPEDEPYFRLRWSPEWQRRSLAHLTRKWGLRPDGLVRELAGHATWRYQEALLKPRLRRVPLIGRSALWWKLGRRLFKPLLWRWGAAAVAADDRRRAEAPRPGRPRSA